MRYLFSLCLMLLCITPAIAKPIFPDRGGVAVYDPTHSLPAAYRDNLNHNLVAWEQRTHHQMVVAIIPDLQGLDIKDYGYQLGRAWHLGQDKQDDAVLILVKPDGNKTQIRIEVGTGLEPVLTDAKSHEIRVKVMNRAYKTGGLPAALSAGTTAIATYIDTNEKEIPIRKSIVNNQSDSTLLFLLLALLGSILAFFLWRKTRHPKIVPNKTPTDLPSNGLVFKDPAFVSTHYPYRQFFSTPPNTFNQRGLSSTPTIVPIVTSFGDYNDSGSDDSDDRRSYSSSDNNDVFTSNNTDTDNFSGGGDDGYVGDDS